MAHGRFVKAETNARRERSLDDARARARALFDRHVNTCAPCAAGYFCPNGETLRQAFFKADRAFWQVISERNREDEEAAAVAERAFWNRYHAVD